MNITAIFPLSRSKMLILLGIYLDGEDYLRNIERKTKINSSLLHRNLHNLLKSGFLYRTKKGREYFYSISNEEKKLISPLLERYYTDLIVYKYKELKVLVKMLYGNPELIKHCETIYLFGSFVSGRVNSDSDIDILFVTSDKKRVINWCSETSTIVQRTISPLIYHPKQFKRELARNEPLLTSVIKNLRSRVVLK